MIRATHCVRAVIVLIMIGCGGCSLLDPNYVHRDPNMISFTPCLRENPQGPYEGVRYSFSLPMAMLEPHCNAGFQYYKRQDITWIHADQARKKLTIKSNLSGRQDHYNMTLEEVYKWLVTQDEGYGYWDPNLARWRTSELSLAERNGMQCIRREVLIRRYKGEPYDSRLERHQMSHRYNKTLSYYCWPEKDAPIYLLLESELLGADALPPEVVEEYMRFYVSGRVLISDDMDIYKDVEIDMVVDLEREIMQPLFDTLVVKSMPAGLEEKMNQQWRQQCESRAKSFGEDYPQEDSPGRKYRELYLQNCAKKL